MYSSLVRTSIILDPVAMQGENVRHLLEGRPIRFVWVRPLVLYPAAAGFCRRHELLVRTGRPLEYSVRHIECPHDVRQCHANKVAVSTVRDATAAELEDENVEVWIQSGSSPECRMGGDIAEGVYRTGRRGYSERLNSKGQRSQQATSQRMLKESLWNAPRHGLTAAGC